MPRQGVKPRRVVPSGLSDAVDGSDAFPGAMAMLRNLIRQPNARGVFVPRPAAQPLAQVPDYTGDGPVMELAQVGNTIYGMAASDSYAGKDRPFVYDGQTGTFTPVLGLDGGLLPDSPAASGPWTPPSAEQVAGRVLFTHPGFAGGTTAKPVFLAFQGNTHSNTTIDNVFPATQQLNATSQILTAGLQVFGPDIAPGTTIAEVVVDAGGLSSTITLSQAATGSNNIVFFFAVSGPPAPKFGWLDISGFATTQNAQTFDGVPAVIGGFLTAGIQAGMSVVGAGIPADTVVQNVVGVAIGGANNTVGLSVLSGQTTAAISVVNNQMIGSGMQIGGVGIPPGCFIYGVLYVGSDATNTVYVVTLSQAALADLTLSPVTLTGTVLVLSKAATANADQVALTIAGGTPQAPMWGAGDLEVNPIAGTDPPVHVCNWMGRAAFAVNTPDSIALQFSDAGTPTRQTFASQALTFDNGVPITACHGNSALTQLGGVVGTLIVFQSDTEIQQITGDFSTGNIFVQPLFASTGTLAANAICATPRGLLFIASDGLRMVSLTGQVTDPIGADGQGLSLPFINASVPSRIAAGFNENVYRVTVEWEPPPSVQSVWGATRRTDEFWFHLAPLGQPLENSRWSGPHDAHFDDAAAWPEASSFIIAPQKARGWLYRSDPFPTILAAYGEFGEPMDCVMRTLLLPDDPAIRAISADEATIFLGLQSGAEEVLIQATDDMGQTLDLAYVWPTPFSTPAHRPILWSHPLVFRQVALTLIAGAYPQLQIGAITMWEKPLGYQLPYPVPQEFIAGQDIAGGPSDAGP